MGVGGQFHTQAALPWERPGTHCIGSWVDAENPPCQDCLAHNESLHQLSYPGPETEMVSQVPLLVSYIRNDIVSLILFLLLVDNKNNMNEQQNGLGRKSVGK
jgi:hypothetical protein